MEYLRGFLVGVGFLFVVEVLAVLLVCFVLFDPLRKTVRPPPFNYSGSAASPGSTNLRPANETKDSKERKPPGSTASATYRKATDPSNEHDEPWPNNIVEYLRNALTPAEGDTPLAPILMQSNKSKTSSKETVSEPTLVLDPAAMGPTHPCDWANVVLHRFFLSLRDSQLFKDRMKARTTERMNMKLQNNSFVSHVNILDISLGDNVPSLNGLRLLKGVTEDLAVFIEVDVDYRGGGSVAIETTLTAGLSVPVRVYLSSFSGKLRIRCPSAFWQDMLAVAFVSDPGIQFVVDSPITLRENEMVRGVVNNLLAGILRKVFLEMWVLPSWRYFFLPLMIPSPLEEMTRMIAANSKNPGATFVRSGKASAPNKATTLWDSRSAILRSATGNSIYSSVQPTNLKVLDIIGSRAFPTSSFLLPGTDLSGFEESLVSSFLSLAKDKGSSLTTDTFNTASSRLREEVVANKSIQSTMTNLSYNWKTIKTRNGVHVQRCRQASGSGVAEVTRATINIACDSERVYAFLSNPEHYRFIEDGFTYVDTNIVKSLDDTRLVRRSTFIIPKAASKELTVFEVRRTLNHSASETSENRGGLAAESFIIVLRSVAGYKEHDPSGSGTALNSSIQSEPLQPPSEPPVSDDRSVTPSITTATAPVTEARTRTSSDNRSLKDVAGSSSPPTSPISANIAPTQAAYDSKVMVFGYLIEPDSASPSTCTVTVVSQFSSDLARLEVAFGWCRKIKTVVEEIVSRTSTTTLQQPSSELRRRRIFGNGSPNQVVGEVGSEKRIEKIRNLVSSGAAYIMKNRKVAGWLGRENTAKESSADGSTTAPEISAEDRDDIEAIAENLAQVEMTQLEEIELADDVFFQMSEEEHDSDSALDFVSDGASRSAQKSMHLPSSEGASMASVEIPHTNGITVKVNDAAPILPPRPTVKPLQSDSSSIASAASTTSMVSNLTGMMPENFKASAVAIARSVAKRRSFSFLKRGGDPNSTVDDEGDDIGDPLLDMSFSVGMNFGDQPHVVCKIPGKDIVRVEIPFTGAANNAVEVAWDFVVRSDQNIMFGLLFKPRFDSREILHSSESRRDASMLFPESAAERGVRQLLPLANIHSTTTRPFRGSLCLSSFSPGTLIFVFDNTIGKKIPREIAYRVAIRPFVLPRPISLSESTSVGENVGEFGLGTKPHGYCSGIVGEVVVQRKSIYRASVVYDPLFDGDEGISTMTYLTWDFTTNSLDVMFAVYFTPDATIPPATIPPRPVKSSSGVLNSPTESSEAYRTDDGTNLDSPNTVILETNPTADTPDFSGALISRFNASIAEDGDTVKVVSEDSDTDHSSLGMVPASEYSEPSMEHSNEHDLENPKGGLYDTRAFEHSNVPNLPPRGESGQDDNKVSVRKPVSADASSTPPPKPARGIIMTATSSPPKPPRRAPPSSTASDGSERISLQARLANVVSRDSSAPTSSPLTPVSSSTSSSAEASMSASPAEVPSAAVAAMVIPTRSTSPALATSPLATSPVHHYDADKAAITSKNSIPPSPVSSHKSSPPVGSFQSSFAAGLRHHPKAEAIVPPTRVSSHRGSTLSGAIAITGRRGLYSFVWDNSHSVVLNKVIGFRVGTVSNSEDNQIRSSDGDDDDISDENHTVLQETESILPPEDALPHKEERGTDTLTS